MIPDKPLNIQEGWRGAHETIKFSERGACMKHGRTDKLHELAKLYQICSTYDINREMFVYMSEALKGIGQLSSS